MRQHSFNINEISSVISELNLDLTGKTVLTEAATGSYAVTAIIAALSGARVYAYAKSSRYGSVTDVFHNMELIADGLGAEGIKLIDKLTPEVIGEADIITNSGHLRPLDRDKLKYLKSSAVIPVMYEKWELRDTDIDIEYCRKNGVRVAGTNERHSCIGVFDYLGDMVIKQILDAGLCLAGRRFVLISNNDFGPYLAEALVKLTDKVGVVTTADSRADYCDGVVHVGEFPDIEYREDFFDADAVIFTAAPFKNIWIGENCPITPEKISSCFRNPYILRYAGDISEDDLKKHEISFYPLTVQSGHMGIIPSDVGWAPVIRLQAGGLKAGELMLKEENFFKGELLADMVN